MPRIPASLPAAAGLLGGYGVARWSGKRELGGVVLAIGGGLAAREWGRRGGVAAAVGMSALYVGAFGGSHPLAKKLGAWPSVFAVTGGVVAASVLVERRERAA
ncbi:hypothetical protein ABT160_03165 [Streptomyces sp. NPDC001941]|uniref:hypothetical protein n=1 Tax=Streptomyces sp. NPDC001941 TaxID=3154659 RepID=UPI00333015DA